MKNTNATEEAKNTIAQYPTMSAYYNHLICDIGVIPACLNCEHFAYKSCECIQRYYNKSLTKRCQYKNYRNAIKALGNPEWHHISLRMIDQNSLKPSHRKANQIISLIKDMSSCKQRYGLGDMASNILRMILKSGLSCNMKSYLRKKLSEGLVLNGYYSSLMEESFGCKKSRRYNRTRRYNRK